MPSTYAGAFASTRFWMAPDISSSCRAAAGFSSALCSKACFRPRNFPKQVVVPSVSLGHTTVNSTHGLRGNIVQASVRPGNQRTSDLSAGTAGGGKPWFWPSELAQRRTERHRRHSRPLDSGTRCDSRLTLFAARNAAVDLKNVSHLQYGRCVLRYGEPSRLKRGRTRLAQPWSHRRPPGMHPNVRLNLEPHVCTAARSSGAVKLGIKLCDKARQVFCNRQSLWGTHHAGVRSLKVNNFRCRSSGAPHYFHLA
jgi:hypothetical protein